MSRIKDVIITNAAADPAGAVLGMGREQAKTWLDRAKRGGQVTDALPPPYASKRSRSGYFVLVRGTLIMPLTRGREGDWLATGCEFFPDWLKARGLGGEKLDPFALNSAELTKGIGFSEHALDRYAQRAAGFPQERRLTDYEKDQAKAELRRLLSRDARAVRRPPGWYRTSTKNDFLVVGQGEEICMAMRHTPGSAQPFTALTVLHQSMELFDMQPDRLARACRFTPQVIDQAAAFVMDGQRPGPWLSAQITGGGAISWHPPRGHDAYPGARFYVHAGQIYLPAAWDKQDRHNPLVVLGLVRTKVSISRRILTWLRGRLS